MLDPFSVECDPLEVLVDPLTLEYDPFTAGGISFRSECDPVRVDSDPVNDPMDSDPLKFIYKDKLKTEEHENNN